MRLMRCKIEGLGPEDRLVLALFWKLFGSAGSVQLRAAQLMDCLGVSQHVLMRSLSNLSAADAFLLVRKVSVGRGRPSRSFEISPKVQACLNTYSDVSCPLVCMQAIENLLSMPKVQYSEPASEGVKGRAVGIKRPPVRKKSNQLSLGSRWLLAVLVSHASSMGVVLGLGRSYLQHLTGMSEPRLKEQLLRLAELGIIRCYVPGVSCVLFKETKVSTTYFLNLSHSFFGLQSGRSAVYVTQEEWVDRRLDLSFAARPAVELFLHRLRDEVFNVFCIRLEGYISFLLSTHWSKLKLPLCSELNRTLQGIIAADFRRPDGRSAGSRSIDEGDWLLAIEYFAWLSFERARKIKDRLARMPAGDLDGAKFQLIPISYQLRNFRITTLLIERSPVLPYNCLVIKYTGIGSCQLYKSEDELTKQERHFFGLQMRPAG